MRSLWIALLLLSAVIVTAAEQLHTVTIRGWEFPLPAFLKQKVTEGPDFTITYFSSDERQITAGIYEGTAPQQFSEKKAGVAREKVTIDGQATAWAIWTEAADGRKQYHAEMNFQIDPKATIKEQFHVFMTAATAEDLRMMREAFSHAHRTPNKSLQATATAP